VAFALKVGELAGDDRARSFHRRGERGLRFLASSEPRRQVGDGKSLNDLVVKLECVTLA
jgi:hypothetical protein